MQMNKLPIPLTPRYPHVKARRPRAVTYEIPDEVWESTRMRSHFAVAAFFLGALYMWGKPFVDMLLSLPAGK